MRSFSILVLSLSVVLLLTGCVPKKSEKDPSTSQEQTATLENQTNAKYQAYSAAAVPEGQKMVFFFHADWCPTCVKWEKSLIEKTGMLPETTQIFKVDFDTETELRAKYGVTKQSTAVFIDESGRVRKTAADPSIEAVAHFFNQETPKEEVKVDPNKDKYLSYSPERLSEGKVAVFFHAEWCPTCRKWEEDLKANLSNLPANTRILKADYDGMKELVKDYGVTKQSTVVFLDEKGNVAKKLMDPSLDKVAEFFGAKIKIESDEKVEKEVKSEVEAKKMKEAEVQAKEDEVDEVTDREDGDQADEETKSAPANHNTTRSNRTQPATDDPEEEAEVVAETEASVETEIEVEAAAEPRYEVYSEKAVKALEGQKYILNFNATWCPNCRKLDSEINGLLSSFPEGTVILKTDYDEYIELKKKYGVTQQTTFVMVNADGSHQTKTGASTDDIMTFFN